jgi:hypothetical protein
MRALKALDFSLFVNAIVGSLGKYTLVASNCQEILSRNLQFLPKFHWVSKKIKKINIFAKKA